MNKSKQKIILKIPVLFFIVFIVVSRITAAEQSMVYSVEWIGEISTSKSFLKEKSFGKKLMDFVFGKTDFALKRPMTIYADSPENFWIVDRGFGQIVRGDRKNNLFGTVPGDGKSYLESPVAICKGAGNNLYFTDSKQNRIYVLNTMTKQIEQLNDTLNLSRPTGIAYAKTRNEIWLVETGRHRLLVLDKTGKLIKSIGTRGIGKGEFNFPTFIWIDSSGTIFVVDSMNFRVQVFDQEGNFITMFGKAGDATGYFAHPKGIATDSYGHIYVVDALFHTVQIFDQKGRFLYNFGKQGRRRGEFWMPVGIFIDSNDRIYVADSYNKRIQIFDVMEDGKDEN